MLVSTAGTIVKPSSHPSRTGRMELSPLCSAYAAPKRHCQAHDHDLKEVYGNVLLILTKKSFFLNFFFINFRHLLAITFVQGIQ